VRNCGYPEHIYLQIYIRASLLRMFKVYVYKTFADEVIEYLLSKRFLCFTLSLQSTPFISLSTSFWHQFLISYSPIPSPITSSSFDSPLCSSITPSLFHSRLKTYLFHKSFLFFLPDYLHGMLPGPFLLSYSVLVFLIFFCLCAVRWPSHQLLSACKYTGSLYLSLKPKSKTLV